MESLRDRIRAIQEVKSKSVRNFALTIGCNQPTISKQLKGEMSVNIDTVLSILNAYSDVSAEWLMRGVGDMLIGKAEEKAVETEKDTTDSHDREFLLSLLQNMSEQNKMLIEKLSR